MLDNVIENKKSYLESIIHNSEKPIIKKKAKELFPELIYKLKNSIKIKLPKSDIKLIRKGTNNNKQQQYNHLIKSKISINVMLK